MPHLVISERHREGNFLPNLSSALRRPNGMPLDDRCPEAELRRTARLLAPNGQELRVEGADSEEHTDPVPSCPCPELA